jgi:LmbE family N-acetylglucosaminyl deacetylase
VNVVAFFAHPDDESMLSGGVLALLARQGASVHYLSATRGEGGELGEPPITTHERLGSVREREMACAVQVLGGASLTFMDYVDPLVGPQDELYPYTEDIDSLASQAAEWMNRFEAGVVITHGSNGEYGHPAHRVTHQAARRAVETLGDRVPLLYTAAAFFAGHPRPRLANQDDPADWVVDISPVLALKVEAAMCHATQHPLFVRRASQEAGRQMTVPEVVGAVTVESLHRVRPPAKAEMRDEVSELLSDWILPG